VLLILAVGIDGRFRQRLADLALVEYLRPRPCAILRLRGFYHGGLLLRLLL
jgi:hypothetical protein